MRPSFNFRLSRLLFSAFLLPASIALAQPSTKRGVCANKLSPEDFAALQPGVSWYYNWFHDDHNAGTAIAFQPMIWNGGADRIAGAQSYLGSHPKPRMLMGLNEPNLRGQANLAPKDAAAVWVKISQLAKSKGVPLVGPHMAISAPGNEIVMGFDPVQNKERNLSYMIDFLDAFFFYAGKDSVDGIGIHCYGNAGELKWAVGELYKKYGKPIWVTEFAQWGAKDAFAEVEYMMETVDFMERSPQVAGYAWFKERMGKGNKMSLLAEESGKLTKLGNLYVHMPVHDAAVFYPVPGRIEAEGDVRMSGVKLELTSDDDGWFNAGNIDAGDWMEYQLNVATAGTYTVNVRAVEGAATLRITQKGAELATVSVPKPEGDAKGATGKTTIRLAAGRQTIRVEAVTGGFGLNWLEFKR
jgi:hypothetical protein